MKVKNRRHPFLNIVHLQKYLFGLILAIVLGIAFFISGEGQDTAPPKTGEPPVLYANQCHNNLTQIYTSAIESAKSSICLVVYSLTDQNIISSLKAKSLEGVDVRVTCDAKASPYVSSKLGPKVHTMRRFGPGLMHQKILVVDNKVVWLGSANMTQESLCMHGNLVTAMESPELANEITAKAGSLDVEGKGPLFSHNEFNVGGQRIELWFLPDNRDAVRRIKNLIQSAKKTVRIAMFTWTRLDLAQTVIRCAKRGVDTQVVIDHYSAKGASAKIYKLLKDNGVQVYKSRGGPLLHHKFLYIDNAILVNGSANWTKAAFTQNDDCFIVMHEMTNSQVKQMNDLWKTISADVLIE